MEYREGSAVCWSLQPTGRVPVSQIPGRIVGSAPGFVLIRVFDTEVEHWIERSVRPITLRRISPQQAEVLERQEAAWPVASAGADPTGSDRWLPGLKELASTPSRTSGLLTSGLSVEQRRAGPSASPNISPGRGNQLATGLGNEQRSLLEIADLRASVGRGRKPDTDLHIRTAYCVLVNGGTLDHVGRLAGITREQVRQRVRLGVGAALDYVTDPVRERIRDATLPRLRRHVFELKPALETAFLALPVVTPKRVAAARQSPRR
jgi:hypothetical protein